MGQNRNLYEHILRLFMSKDNSQNLSLEFTPGSTIVIPNQMKAPKNITVSFDGVESVTATVIMGGEISIKCGDRPPVITINDVEQSDKEL